MANERHKKDKFCVISGFYREVDENCDILGYYKVSSGNSLPTFRDNPSVPSSRAMNHFTFITLEDGADGLSRNVGKEVPLLAV